jgi:Galactose oxidase, central domain
MRCLLTAALDPGARTTFVHGGQRTGPLDDTWAFDLGTREWTNLTPEIRPSGRMLASSFASREGHLLVFAGATNAGRVNETWGFELAVRVGPSSKFRIRRHCGKRR